jgi:hypothetical protein
MKVLLRSLICALLIGASAGAVPAAAAPAHKATAAQADNAEMTAIFNADQSDRQNLGKIDWSAVAPRDEARRARTKALLDSGKLLTGDDFYHAAFVFQHGSTPGDYLLAHTLAVIAAARGRKDATWIAAATLDRYLMNIGQKQIYGTQFVSHNGGAMSQEPYDRTLVSDALRADLGVPPMKEQVQRMKEIEAQLGGAKTKP